MSNTFKHLADKYRDGFRDIDTGDFEGVSSKDRLRLMEDVTGTDVIRVGIPEGGVRMGDDDEDKKKKKPGHKKDMAARTFRYTMSTQNPVGQFGDVVQVKGWDLRDFKKRGQPFLYGHNVQDDRHPLGRMSGLLKGAEEDFVKGEPVLAGNATFSDEGINPFNDLTHDMVAAGFMPGSSVGFRILKSRQPTDEEMAQDGRLKKWSFVAEKASLVEFSAVSVGMDPDAVKRRSLDGGLTLDAKLAEYVRDGRYDEDLISEFREQMLGTPEAKGRSHIAFGDGIETSGYVDAGLGGETERSSWVSTSTQDQGASAPDTDSTESVRTDLSARDDSTDQTPESPLAPTSIRLSDTIRALEAMGLQDCGVEFIDALRAVTGEEHAAPEPDSLHAPVSLAEFREENESLRALTERLEQRLTLLEGALLPESVESGDIDVFRAIAGDEGDAPGAVDLYSLLYDENPSEPTPETV